MSAKTTIQWCNSTVNPVMGCHGCELWPTLLQIISSLIKATRISFPSDPGEAADLVKKFMEEYDHATAVWHDRFNLSLKLADNFPTIPAPLWLKRIESQFKCYAGILHMARGANSTDWDVAVNKGHAPVFDHPKKFPGRMAAAANLPDLKELPNPDSPWLSGMSRLIFVSDMGDALSASIDFDYLKEEIIDTVTSPKGRRHIWLWLTKRPKRMAEFARWIKATHGLSWPDNLVAMTSVTNRARRSRIGELREVPAKLKGLSVEPLAESVSLELDGIDWVIVGGESGSHARTFDLSWARDLQTQCQEAGVAFFMKQLGATITDDGFPMKVRDKHGGDWSEWPTDLRVREFPEAFRDGSLTSPIHASVSNPNNRNF